MPKHRSFSLNFDAAGMFYGEVDIPFAVIEDGDFLHVVCSLFDLAELERIGADFESGESGDEFYGDFEGRFLVEDAYDEGFDYGFFFDLLFEEASCVVMKFFKI
jgi:hypothetical protein